MLHNMGHPQDQLPIEEVASPLGAQLLEFCEYELFPEPMHNSEVASSSNFCYEEQSSYQTQPSITTDMSKYSYHDNNNSIMNKIQVDLMTPTTMHINNNNLSVIFDTTDDQLDNDISASIDFSQSSIALPHHQYINQINNNIEPFDISSLNNSLTVADMSQYERLQGLNNSQAPTRMLCPTHIPMSYEDECGHLSYMHLRTSMDPVVGSYMNLGDMSGLPFCGESSNGIFAGGGLMHENVPSLPGMDFQGDNGLFISDSMARVFNGEPQALSNESQHLVHGGGSSSTPLATGISSLDDPTYKVGKLSSDERKRKIHRYMKKRNERNFSKKIKYACRKTLADSRPRVRGRFAKNDEHGEMARTNGSNNEYDDTDEDVSLYSNSMPQHQCKVRVKEEENTESSEIFAHISGVNSLKCNYPIQSWI